MIETAISFPIDIHIGSSKISAHLLLESLAYLAGFRYYLILRRRQQDTISNLNRVWILIGAAFGAFLFSRVIGSLENPQGWIDSRSALIYFFASKTIVGGLFGGLLGVELTKKLIGEHQSSGDLFTQPIIVAMIIGRLGCFTQGVYEETFGSPTSLPWAMDLGDGIGRHPVTLYEILYLLLLWSIIAWIQNRIKLLPGMQFRVFMLAYFLFRFWIEFIKPTYVFPWGLTTIQMTCFLLWIYYYKTIGQLIASPKSLLRHE